ncbi:MAG TPA: hypothetical protein VFB38_05090 [Chthonomonadaceae bacterium]|nr:hypothetical protein [Chthonomonadaceae bacterium]
MKEPSRARSLLLRALGGAALLGLAVGLYLAYRWANSTADTWPHAAYTAARTVAVRLESTPFENYVRGHKTWSLWAGRIDLERLPGAALTSIQSATISDIRNGKLYQPPPEADSGEGPTALPSGNSIPSPPDGSALARGEPPTATFHARRGRYAVGLLDPIPADLRPLYEVRWQFKLEGGVDFQTRAGDRLRAESLTILDLINRRTRRPERRILGPSGAQVTLKDVQLSANQVRYDPDERTVECLGGVRGTFKDGAIQAERVFWSLKDQVIRCPETATGTFQGMPCTWEGLTLDLKRRRLYANVVHAQIRIESIAP